MFEVNRAVNIQHCGDNTVIRWKISLKSKENLEAV